MFGHLLFRPSSFEKLKTYTLAKAAGFLLWSVLPLLAGGVLLYQHVVYSLQFGISYGLPPERAALVLLGKGLFILIVILGFVQLLSAGAFFVLQLLSTGTAQEKPSISVRSLFTAYLVTIPTGLTTFLIPLGASNLGRIAASVGTIAAMGWTLGLLALANTNTQDTQEGKAIIATVLGSLTGAIILTLVWAVW